MSTTATPPTVEIEQEDVYSFEHVCQSELPDEKAGTDFNECGECGVLYEPYLVLVRNNFNDACQFARLDAEYDGLCRDCRLDMMDDPVFSTMSEHIKMGDDGGDDDE